ncbi:Dedicator of cytokinesis protein 1 [Schistosoma japonicum]|nr:Dedicator of cytokinesis protein 1 [Schistosoma japonicum]KAH8876955.1 Dedicator of cytokinesis protein 1 [Schistosoma japonicum]
MNNGITQPRRELYVTLISGNFSKGNKTREHNIEVEVSVIDSSGNGFNLSNSPERFLPVHKSVVYYHKNQPYWSELFTITLPYSQIESSGITTAATTTINNVNNHLCSDDGTPGRCDHDLQHQHLFSPNPTYPGMLAGVHLRFLCRHRSTGPGDSEGKLLGVAYLRLQPSTSVPVLLPDGDYHLYIHKMDMSQVNSCRYLCQPSYCEDDGPMGYGSSSGSGSGSSFFGHTVSSNSLNSSGLNNILSLPNFSISSSSSRSRLDTLHIQTLVCSSFHTTDENLTKVLLWRNYQDDIVMCLRQGIYLSRKDNELRKFTRSLIDNMLQLLMTTMDETHQHITNLNLGYSLLMGLARCYKDLSIDSFRQQLIHNYLSGPGFTYCKIYIPYLQLLNAMLCEITYPTLYQNHPTTVNSSSTTSNRCKLDHHFTSSGYNNSDINNDQNDRIAPHFFDLKAVQLIFSTVHWAFLIIVRSRHLDIMQLNDKWQKEAESLFAHQVESFLSGVIDVTCRTDDVLLRLIIFKHVPEIIKSLTKVYPKFKLSQFIVRLIARTLESTELPSQKILTETIHSSLFSDPQCRHLLVPVIQTSLTQVFTEKLDKVLSSKVNENTAIMDVWCDVLLAFVDSFTKATTPIANLSSSSITNTQYTDDNVVSNSDHQDLHEADDKNIEHEPIDLLATPTRKLSFALDNNNNNNNNNNNSDYVSESDEIYSVLIKRNLLRWTMQQLARILLFIHQRNSTTLCCDGINRLDSFSTTGSSVSNSISTGQSSTNKSLPSPNKCSSVRPPSHPSYYRLQPIMGCLSTVLFSLLQMLTKISWIKFLQSAYYSNEECCRCNYCHNLQLVNIYDFLHELFSLLSLMHLYPAYPAPMFQSRSERLWAVGRYSWDDDYDESRSENYDQKTLLLSSSPSHGNSSISYLNMNRRHNNSNYNAELFSKSWIEMLALISHSELDVIEVLIELVIKPYFITCNLDDKSSTAPVVRRTEPCLTTDLIELIAQCLTGFAVEQAHLCVESMPSVTRTRIDQGLVNQSTDMRQRACDLLLSLWHSIDDQSKVNYIHIFIPNVINMATLPLPKIRENCVDCILSALAIHSSTVEHVFVSEIDRVVQWAGTDFAADIRNLLQNRFSKHRNPLPQPPPPRRSHSTDDSDHRQRVINDFSKQIDCLLHYGKFINHPSQMSEMLAFCNLRKFYESINRKDMILRYLYRLDRLHAAYSNKTERGYTLELISENYSWDEASVDVNDVSPHYIQYGKNSSRALRERLLLDSFEFLKQGTDWEHAIEISNKLIHLYRDIMPNYERLSEILKEQADLYKAIVTNEHSRLPFRYYLVEFYEPDSSGVITNRKLIYRTISDLGDVLNMLTEQFPDATILNQPLTSNNQSTVNKFCIFASGNLEPEPEIPEHLNSRIVDNKVKSYYCKNRVKYFLRHRPLQPTEKKDGRLVTNTEETRYCIAEPMPNIIPIMPVDRVEIRMLSQTEWANKQIQGIIQALHTDLLSARSQDANVSQYIGKLVSSIQSPVSGGVPKLVKDVELSDDPRQEKCFTQLADSVLELLELQLTFLKFWYVNDPPPPPASHRLATTCNTDIVGNVSSSSGVVFGSNNVTGGVSGSGNYLLYEMIGYYEVLVRDMSRKFGFSVDHLNADNLRYGPVSTDRQTTSNHPNTSLLSPLRRNSRSSQNIANTGVATISQSTIPRIFSKPDHSTSDHVSIRSLQRSFQTVSSGRTPLDPATFSSPVIRSNSSFNILSSDPPPLPDRPILTKPTQLTNIFTDRPATLDTTNNINTTLSVSSNVTGSSFSTVGSHDDRSSSPRGNVISITSPNDEARATQHLQDPNNSNISNHNSDKSVKQVISPIVVARFDSSPNTIRNRSRPLPPLPPTPVRSSSIARTENSVSHQSMKLITPTSNCINGTILSNSSCETAPPLPERKIKTSCSGNSVTTPVTLSPGHQTPDNSPSFDFT